jgi:signal transduction histidine kinase
MISLSLKWRVSLLVTIVLVAIITTISIVAYIEFKESHLRTIDRTLLAMANGILASLHEGEGEEQIIKDIHEVTATYGQNPPNFYRIWMDGASTDLFANVLSGSERGRWLHELSEQSSPPQGEYVLMNIGRRGNEYRAVWMRQKIDTDIANIIVASSSHFTFHETREFLTLLLILGGSLTLASVIAVTWSVRCGLRPIKMTTGRLRDITHPNIRMDFFDDLKVPEELHPFVGALKNMLDRLDKVLQRQKQFTSDAAHELRTPLALAKSTLQAAHMCQRDADEYGRAITDALKDIACMEHLIEQLLILARMDEAGTHILTAEVQLDVLLRELTETFGKKMEKFGGKVVFEEPAAVTIRGDIDSLIRLFSNVLDNAVKYGPSNGTIRITLKSEPDNHVAVYIHDGGGNIPSDSLPHLFDRFYRVDQSRSSSTGGFGLGLAIAREIARYHNGNISITSDPSSGTLVCIRLALI